MVETQSIVVLDFGSQYTQLIARRIREQNVFSVVLPCTASLKEIKSYAPAGIILSGGPSSVYDADAPPADEQVLHLGVPVLGICYGLHYMTHKLGGKVRPGDKREYGHADVELLRDDCALFKGLTSPLHVWMSHGDEAEELPPGFELVARSSNAKAAFQDPATQVLRRAVSSRGPSHHREPPSCATSSSTSAACSQLDAAALHRRNRRLHPQAGRHGRVICGLSGGVDSSVAAVLVHRAIGDQLTCIFVNNGVLRKNELQTVQKNLRDKLGLNIDAVDATDLFLGKLARVKDPEKKRKIIGEEFITVFEQEARASPNTAKSTGWCRARFIPTSSSRVPCAAPRRPSRAITTSEACPSA